MTQPTPTRAQAASHLRKTPGVDRQTIQQIYVRVCRDSGFKLDMFRACALAAKMAGKHPLDIWVAMPSLDVMQEIAAGTHPAAQVRQ